MTVDTKKVAQRREVLYDFYDDLSANAERLVNGVLVQRFLRGHARRRLLAARIRLLIV